MDSDTPRAGPVTQAVSTLAAASFNAVVKAEPESRVVATPGENADTVGQQVKPLFCPKSEENVRSIHRVSGAGGPRDDGWGDSRTGEESESVTAEVLYYYN